jgi:HSP20 family molecular chaperone IbpA
MIKTAEVELKNAETPEKTREIIYNELRRDVADWMEAKQDLVWRPSVELTEEGDEFIARALLPGVDPENLEIFVSPERILIKGETHRGKPDHQQLLRSMEFPRPVDPENVHAEIREGALSVKAKIAAARNVVFFRPRAA